MSDRPRSNQAGDEPPEPLKVDVRRLASAPVVRIEGSASFAVADKLRSRLEKLAAEQAPLVVLDLTALDFICSPGLGAIISLHIKSRHHAGRIRLVNPQPAVLEILGTTRLTKLFPIFPNVEQALRQS
ncbi:MAG: STAS domain-containing protein [Phycisphaerae bacterium]